MKSYPCIGGPLDGTFMSELDQRKKAHWVNNAWIEVLAKPYDEYFPFNRAGSHTRTPSRIYVHKSLIQDERYNS